MLPQNVAHVHLILNTIPYIGMLLGIILVIMGWWRRKPDIVRTALLIFMVVSLISVVVYLTGLGAEGVVAGLPDVSHELIEAHEKSAFTTLLVMITVGVFSAGGYYFHRRVRLIAPNYLRVLLLLAVVALGLVVRTSLMGGRINHPEVRAGYSPPPPGSIPALESDPGSDTLISR